MTRRRFCMITTYYPPYHFGGDAVYVHRLANELARRGHEVHVIHCIDSYLLGAGGREPTVGYHDHPNVIIHGLRSRVGPLSPLATQQTGWPLFKTAQIKAILDQGFDIIHYHNISLVGGPKVLELGQAIKLYTMHEYWLVCPTHILFKYNQEVCTQRDCFTCQLTYHRPPQWWRHSDLLAAATQHVDLFLAPSRFSIDIHRRFGFDAQMAYLPLFVPPLSFPQSPISNLQSPVSPYFLYVGRLEKLKGVHTLLPLFRRYPQLRLLIAGAGSYETELRRQAEGLSNVVFLGPQTYAALAPLYRAATALIVPSLCYEVGPLVVLEAFQQGTPVMVRDIGGLPELIEASEGGLSYATEKELEAALLEMANASNRRDDLGQRGRAAWGRLWTPDTHLARYFALIDEVETRREAARRQAAALSTALNSPKAR